MARAIVLRRTGGPEVLELETIEVGAPGPGEARLRQTAIGVNFHDTYVRAGSYRTLALPGIPGVEAVGVVEAVGEGVAEVRPGDRVGYVLKTYGGYASERLIAADRLIRIPDAVDDRTAAAVLVKGLTAWMLLSQFRPMRAGDTALVHAAAGGVGRLLTQWASHLGVRVIATVGDAAKAETARADGAAHVILYRDADVVGRVAEITGGRGVDVAYDAVGRDTFLTSLEALAVRGWLINYGQASGPVEGFQVSMMSPKSNILARPMLFDWLVDPTERSALADRLFDALASGIVRAEIGAEHALANAAEAHRALEARATMGSTILIP